MKGLKQFGILMAALGFAATGMTFAPAAAQTVDYGGSNGRVHYDHHRDRGDGHNHHRHRRHHADKRHHDDRDRGWRDHSRRNTVIPRGDAEVSGSSGGAYVGNVSGYHDPGNGTYLYIERDGFRAEENVSRPAPSARIIRPGGGSGACSNEAGVCVIRPGG